jgi:hypothetical protein
MLSGVMALFAGLTVFLVTRDAFLALMGTGIVFIVVTIAIAMLLLAVSPNSTPDGEKSEPGTGND